MEHILKQEPQDDDGNFSDSLDDVTDLIRRAESIIEENRERLRRSRRLNAESIRARAMEMLREPSPILEINESTDNPTIPAEILPEQPGCNSSNTDKDDDDDDVVIVDSFQLPQSLQVVDLSTPEHIPPKRRRQRNVENSITNDGITIIIDVPTNFGPASQTNLNSSSCSSSVNNSGQVVGTVNISPNPISSSSLSNPGQSSGTVSLNCPICLDNCRKPTATLCGHIYCEKCIKAAIRATKKCPMCKRQLHCKSTHPLYFN